MDLFWRNSGTGLVTGGLFAFRMDLKPDAKSDNDRYKQITDKKSGRGRLLFVDFEKSTMEAFDTLLSEQ